MASYESHASDDGIIELINKYKANAEGVGIREDFIPGIRQDLLSWYRSNRRLLPWRGDKANKDGQDFDPIMHSIEFPNPYGVWVSEVMLQQTRVETVIPFWIKWMKTFPTVFDLAQANSDDVNKIWAGLGYYRRAQMLLEGAKKVVDIYEGVLPSNVDNLLKIPGIGPYTGGAIASIAYGVQTPVVDGNVIRVFSRLVGSRYSNPSTDMDKLCWSIGHILVDPRSPGDFNQALMELGATVCKPTSANCHECPIRKYCAANQIVEHNRLKTGVSMTSHQSTSEKSKRKSDALTDDNDEEIEGLPISVSYFPRKSAKKKAVDQTYRVKIFAVKENSSYARYLLVRREKKGLLANQWEFPSVCIDDFMNGSTSVQDGAELCDSEILRSSFQRHLLSNFGIFWKSSISDSVDASEFTARFTLMDKPSAQMKRIKDPIVHVFSHQRHTMYLDFHEVISEGCMINSSTESTISAIDLDGFRESRWMTAADILEAGVTTGCKKILAAIEKRDKNSKTTKITNYFCGGIKNET